MERPRRSDAEAEQIIQCLGVFELASKVGKIALLLKSDKPTLTPNEKGLLDDAQGWLDSMKNGAKKSQDPNKFHLARGVSMMTNGELSATEVLDRHSQALRSFRDGQLTDDDKVILGICGELFQDMQAVIARKALALARSLPVPVTYRLASV